MVVVGPGRIGSSLKRRADQRGLACELVGRGGAIVGPGPVILAVRTDELDDAVAAVPSARRRDLVLVQNGAYRDKVHQLGLDGVTRGVLYVLAASKHGDLVPGRWTAFCGPRADDVVHWLLSLGLPARSLDSDAFGAVELEKLLWLCVMGGLGDAYRAMVGEIARDHADDVADLFAELAPVGEAAWGVRLDLDGAVERALDWSTTIPDYRASVKEWPYRDGWLRQNARRLGIATPRHDALVAGR
jgi:hypothetical protein